jgi:oligopeptide transport system substrate-binding protein
VNRLNISFNTYPATLDPRKAGDFASSTLICLVYEGLTRCLPGGGVEPAIAESVELSEDETLYTFHLRKAYWSDGKAITAFDFERSWKEALVPPSLNSYLFYPIKNVEKYVKGERALDEVGIWAIDEKTLQVKLERKAPYFYALTAFPSFFPSAAPSVFSGPFKISEIKNRSEITLVKNPSFWNELAPSIDEIHISIIPDEMTALQMYEQGELDWVGGPLSPLPIDSLKKLEKESIPIPNAATTFCTFNTEIFPFSNLHLRKAFSLAIDRDEVASLLHVTPPRSFLPPPFTRQSQKFSNKEEAICHFAKGLQELGMEKLSKLTLYYRPAEKQLAQVLQKQWETLFGVEMELMQLDPKSHTHRLHNKEYTIAIASWMAQFNDPINFLDRFKEKHKKNYSGWTDPAYTQLIEENHFQEAEKLLSFAVPMTPLYHWESAALCGDRIQATSITPCGGILFERFEISPLAK